MSHAFGWIQDPGSIDNLFKCVELFDKNTSTYSDLIHTLIPKKIANTEIKKQLLQELKSLNRNGQPALAYRSLIGTAFKPRRSAKCNGIIQALIPGQRRNFLADWPADNFLRWAHAMGFIEWDEKSDTFFATQKGLSVSQKQGNRNAQVDILKQAILEYPPAIRILELLNDKFTSSPNDPCLTKFELGEELGFRGEGGFTTYPQHVVIHAIVTNQLSKNKILSNWEGSSDKYARMICGWLSDCDIKWVQQVGKIVTVSIGGTNFQNSIPQSYQITQSGIAAFRRARQRSSKGAVKKRLFFEMLSTRASDREHLRTRRALILQILSKRKINLNAIQVYLVSKNFDIANIPLSVIEDDINNFTRIGLEVKKNQNQRFWIRDKLIALKIPRFAIPQLTPSAITKIKITLANKLINLNHNFLDLIDLSFDANQNRLFEIRIIDLLRQIPNLNALHLGGGNRPDGVAYYPDINPQKGLILDAKSYSSGFSVPISERDKMKRYIDEFNSKSAPNPTKWWLVFQKPTYPPNPINFTFISSRFIGNFSNQIKYIKDTTNNDGSVITSEKLLEKVEDVLDKSNPYNTEDFFRDLSSNGEVQ